MAQRILKTTTNAAADFVIEITNTNRPNIVLVMLESFSAEVIEPLGGAKGITPVFSELAKEGLLATRFYTPGFRTEQGLAALVSGFPSQPTTTIIRQFGKFDRLPSLAASLDSAGYSSFYYHGGNLHFAFTGSYLKAMGFDKIYGEDDFDYKRKTDWGVYDEELFDFFNGEMKETKQPFFSIIMTSTNHEPFDADVEKIVPDQAGDWCDDYINTAHYTDQYLGRLLVGMKKQSWYEHTLVVIVADHAHSCPANYEYNSAPRHCIPCLFLGGALKQECKGTAYGKLASQVDFPATILFILNLEHRHFRWSNNMFNPASPETVFYSFDEGFGLVTNRQQLVYDHKTKQVIYQSNDTLLADENNQYIDYGKAYLQVLMDDYLLLNEK